MHCHAIEFKMNKIKTQLERQNNWIPGKTCYGCKTKKQFSSNNSYSQTTGIYMIYDHTKTFR